jgi:hypothetical protein
LAALLTSGIPPFRSLPWRLANSDKNSLVSLKSGILKWSINWMKKKTTVNCKLGNIQANLTHHNVNLSQVSLITFILQGLK